MKNRRKLTALLLSMAAALSLTGLVMTNCDNDTTPLPSAPPPGGDTVITIAAIGGVTAPVTGATPVTTITQTEQYTGTVTWNGSPATFAASTVYTATVTLKAKTGFTLTGVAANFFTVNGTTSVSNAANSGVITAVFPSTAGTTEELTPIGSAISGVTAPAIGATPVTEIETAQYAGTVTWNGNPATFAASTVYTATITLTPKEGYTLQGVEGGFTVAGAAQVSFNAETGVITAVFPATAAPPYGITLSEIGTYTFADAAAGYGAQTALTVTVTNVGTEETGDLTAALSGTNSGSFTLSTTTIDSIEADETGTFTVVPNTGLAAGTYTATVTVSGDDITPKAFGVSFIVNAEAPTYGITLSATGTHAFPPATSGYGAQTALSVTVTNSGNQATGALTAALSGTNLGSFTLSTTTINSIAASGNDTFTVVPNTGLAARTYTATVTVSGDNSITASFGVSFTVTEADTYGITLSQTSAHTFPAATSGYGAQTALSVTVTNSGNQATGALTTALSGTNSTSFALSKTTINSIAVSGNDTFTVTPKTGLAAGTYTATVTVSGGNNITASFSVSFTVTAAPTYGITLSQSGTHTFTVAAPGYGAQTALSVTVTNSGNQATSALTAALSGTNLGSFTLSTTTINSIAASGNDTFTVTPKTGLTEGAYTATVTVSGSNGITASFGVSFTVTTSPTYGVTLSETGTYTFPAANYGYAAQTARTVTVTNSGNQATGNLTAALSGTNSGSFTLSKTTINSIAVSGNDTFTVTPKTGLTEGAYAATVTVSGGNSITASFGVSFTVTAAPAYGISLSETGTYTFPAANYGYAAQTVQTVTVTNSGNQATGALTAALSGTNSTSFALSKTTINSIAVSGNDTFTVTPNTGLSAGTYTATVTVSGGSNITSKTFTVNFTVNPKVITFAIDAIPAQSYTGSAITPEPVVKDGTTTLSLNTHYTVQYSNNISAGTATVSVTGAGNYAGSTGSATFTISPMVIAFVIDNIADQTYTGSALTPTVTVKDGSTTLSLNTHYTVSYANNINAATSTAANPPTVTVTGAGNYLGNTGSATFTIKPREITFNIDNIADQTYSGSAFTPAVVVKDGSTTLTLTTHYTRTYTNNINAGTATATVTGAGNYAGSSGSKTFTIKPKVITFAIDAIPAQNHTGSAITPTVTVKDGSTTLTLTTHYTVAYSNNINAGTATVTVAGAGNYLGSTGSANFTINAPPTYGISLSQTSTMDFGTLTVGYAAPAVRTVTVTNTGNQATGQLGVDADTDILTVSKTTINSIAVSGNDTFTVTPKTGLGMGIYTTTVTVSGGVNITAQTFDVSFTVTDPNAPYVITGSGTAFTATKSFTTVGTPNQTIQNVIDAIRTDATGKNPTIQFGDGDTLDIGTATASFNNTGGTWGTVTLAGSITGSSNTANSGVITIDGNVSITSTANITNTNTAASTNTRAVYHNSTGTFTISGGTVSAYMYVITNASSGAVTITGGTVSGDYAVYNTSTGTINITGGTISGGNRGVQATNGTVNISGGTVSADGYGVYTSNGNVNISGGTVQGINVGNIAVGIANGTGKVTISGTAEVISVADEEETGTINIVGTNATTTTRLEITGGTVKNPAAGGSAIYSTSPTGITISGGTVQATGTGGYAVYSTNANSMITLGGNPTVTGIIRPSAAGKLTATSFSPTSGKQYTLQYESYAANNVAVVGGASSSSYFGLYNTAWTLAASGGNVVIGNPPSYSVSLSQTGTYDFPAVDSGYSAAPAALSVTVTNEGGQAVTAVTAALSGTGFTLTGGSIASIAANGSASFTVVPNTGLAVGTYTATVTVSGSNITAAKTFNVSFTVIDPNAPYIITGSVVSFTVNRGGAVIGSPGVPIQTAINGIRANAVGKNPTIQFGNSGYLEISSDSVSFANATGETWGAITLTGAIRSSSENSPTIRTSNAISVTSTANIINSHSGKGTAVKHSSTGTFTISGSSVSVYGTGSAISNSGTITISSGSTVSAETGNAVDNTGTVNISGGTVSATTRTTVVNLVGTVNISGGTVSATTGIAVSNNDATSAVNISGGTVSATTGTAVHNETTGKITVSGNAKVTSANVNTKGGTIYLRDSGSASAARLEITGGTVENTAAGGMAIYNASYGAVTISGGTVSATGGAINTKTGTAIYNTKGTVTVSGSGTVVQATTGIGIYNISDGAVNISSGTVKATTGIAVYIMASSGKVTVSGTALVTSANISSGEGTIRLDSAASNAVRLQITGGTISNTAAASNNYRYAIYNATGNNQTGIQQISRSGGTVTGQTYGM